MIPTTLRSCLLRSGARYSHHAANTHVPASRGEIKSCTIL